MVLGNSWIWLIFGNDFWLGMGLVVASGMLYALVSNSPPRRILPLFLLMGVLMWQQWVTTSRVGLAEMSAEERFMRQERVGYYPDWFRRVGVWWELRPEIIGLRRVGGNFFQAIDLNYYFFAGHPREVVGVPIVEKFPVIYYFIFLFGLVSLIKNKKRFDNFWRFIVFGFGLPIGWLSLVGHDNLLGPFVMFPGMVVGMGVGLEKVVWLFINPTQPPLFKGRDDA